MELPVRKTDIAIVVDATGSMGSYLKSLTESLVQIVQIIDITNVANRVCMVAYKDYCDNPIIECSGWITKIDELVPFINRLNANGGGDTPEAAKTAANELLDIVSNNTVVIWYTDAPPHHWTNGGDNITKEKKALEMKNKFFDWVDICREFKKKNIVAYPIIDRNKFDDSSFYVLMSSMTGGKTLYLNNTDSKLISRVTIKLLLGLMGCDYDFKDEVSELVYANNFFPENITNETKHGGYLPGTNMDQRKNICANTLKISTHPFVETNLRSLVDLFNKDANYKNRIYGLFESLLTSHTVLALTYNTVFATFWRLICRNYDDPRRDILRDKLSGTLEFLKKNDKNTHTIVLDWINDSFNQTFEVNEIITKKATSKVPALVIDTARFYTPQELLEINRSCNAKVLSMVVDMMSSLRVIDKEEDLPKTTDELDSKGRPLPIKYIPLSLSNRYLFAILPHLMAPGSNFGLRPSVIMATVAYITNNVILGERAKQHLEYHKGKWIDNTMTENYSGGFINLMLKAKEYLTNEEIEFFNFYQKVYGLIINGSTDLKVRQPVTPFKTVCNDYKKKCDYCNQMRSFTLMTIDSTGKNKCGLCYDGTTDYTKWEQKNASFYFKSTNSNSNTTSTSPAKERCDNTHSYYLECKVCLCNYALVEVEKMNVTPKCHGCRFYVNLPNVQCTKCCNKYVDPSNMFQGKEFVCPQCNVDPKISVFENTVPFRNIYLPNQQIIHSCIGFEMPENINIFGGHSLFALKDTIKKITQVTDLSSMQLTLNKKPILNSEAVIKEMMQWIFSGTAERAFCMICFNECAKSNLRQVCGRKVCKSVACAECLKSWYSANKVGDLLQVNSLTCPFCKQFPSYNILSTYNRQACAMVRDNKTFDIDWWYGWCTLCFKPKKVAEKVCSAEPPKLDGKFICEDCNVITKPEDAKQCPNKECQIAIIKNGGCNHMECTACKKHFCWICSDTMYNTAQETYDHLYKKHGGAFNYDNNIDDNIDDNDFEDIIEIPN